MSLHGVQLAVPSGVAHPGRDPASGFFHRTVGPMIAPGHRVLDLGCGAGIGALVAALRGAKAVALDRDANAVAATLANARAAGFPVVEGEPEDGQVAAFVADLPEALAGHEAFDLVLWNAEQRTPAERATVVGSLTHVPALLGERGRLLVLVERGSGLEAEVREALPEGYRVVVLARDLGLRPAFRVLCVGWDTEAARARRHAERKRSKEAKAAKARQRWDGTRRTPEGAPDDDDTKETRP